MSTYVTALIAGPYHVVRDPHDGIDLGVLPGHAGRAPRRGQAVHRDQAGFRLLPLASSSATRSASTTSCSCPSSTPARWRTPGRHLPRGVRVPVRVTRYLYERRCETILHEMAHMWFGDLVTMGWWDDLWLNESFATWGRSWRRCGHRIHLRLDHVRQCGEVLGVRAGPAAVHPPDRRGHGRSGGGRGELRRHHLRQGRQRAQAARGLCRLRGVPHRAHGVLRRARLRQRHPGRPARRAGAETSGRDLPGGPGLAADDRPEHPTADIQVDAQATSRIRGPAVRRPARRGRAAAAPAGHRHLRRDINGALVRATGWSSTSSRGTNRGARHSSEPGRAGPDQR